MIMTAYMIANVEIHDAEKIRNIWKQLLK